MENENNMEVDARHAEGGLAFNVIEEKDDSTMMDESAAKSVIKPYLPPLAGSKNASATISRTEIRNITVPANRRSPLKVNWDEIRKLLVETLLLDVRYNVKRCTVQIRNGVETKDPGSLQKGEDFVKAFVFGFEIKDAIALIRLDELYLESFDVTEVKTLHGDHLSRAIGRIAGHVGKMKNALENACRTRIVIADKKVHVLGTYHSVQVCKAKICGLIMGKPPSKVFGHLRGTIASLSRTF